MNIASLSASVSSFLTVGLNQAVLSLGAALIIVIFSNLLDPALFGSLRFIAAVLAVLSFFSLPGMSTLLLKDIPLMNRAQLWRTISTQLRWGFGATVGALLVGGFFGVLGDSELALAFVVGGVFAPLANLYLVPGLILAGLKRFRAKLTADAAMMIAIVLGALVGAYLFTALPLVLGAYFLVQAAATLLLLVLVGYLLPREHDNIDATTADLLFGKQLTIFHIPYLLLPALEKIVIFFLLGPSALAVFVIASLPFEHIKNAYRNLLQYYVLPHLHSTAPSLSSLKRWLLEASVFTLLGIGALVLFVLTLVPHLFPDYEEAVPLALLLALALVPLPLQVLSLALVAARRSTALLQYTGASVVISFLVFLAFVPQFALFGAILAKIAFEVLAAALLLAVYLERDPFKWWNTLFGRFENGR